MQALKFKTVIDEKRTLSLPLPADIGLGMTDVIVLLEGVGASESPPAAQSPSDEEFEAFMNFHKGRRLDGITLSELKEEGRR